MQPSPHVRQRRVVGASVLAFIALSGCSSETTVPPSSPVTARTATSTSGGEASQELAVALATVFRSPAGRAELHRVLRASPYTKHKVHLQAWLHEAPALRIVDALGAAMGKSPAATLAYLDALPALEMSFPSRIDRLTWRATDKISVAVQLDRSSDFAGTASNGDALLFPSTVKLPEAVLAVRPMRALVLRFSPQAARPSAVIQDPDDGEVGVRSVTHHANGDSTVLQHATVAKLSRGKDGAIVFAYPPPPDDGGGGGGGGGTYYGPPLKLGLLVVINIQDFNNPYDPNEFRFEATHFNYSGSIIEQRTTNLDGVNYESSEFRNLPLLSGSPSRPAVWNGTHVNMVIYEEDGGWGRDNFFDGQIFSNANVAGTSLVNYPRFRGGADRCGYDYRYSCPLVEPDGSLFYWKQLNFNVLW